jgi:hypothetical protein
MFVSPKFESTDLSAEECLNLVNNDSSCQGNPSYVPYIWNRVKTGGFKGTGYLPDDTYTVQAYYEHCQACGVNPCLPAFEDGTPDYDTSVEEWLPFLRYRYDVTLQDIANFPELRNLAYVIVWENANGYIWSDPYTNDVHPDCPRPISLSDFLSALLDRLSVALEFDLALHKLAPKPIDGLGTDQMIERRDLRILSAIRYTFQNTHTTEESNHV